jgi:protein SCO1
MRTLRQLIALAILACLFSPAMAHDLKEHMEKSKARIQIFEEGKTQFRDAQIFDQTGATLNFVSDLTSGKRFVITSFYTSCESYCPVYHALFQSLQSEFPKHGLADVQLISVSVDPVRDDVDALSKLASELEIKSGWTLVSGEPREMQGLVRSLGFPRGVPEDHPPMFLVGDKTGRIVRILEIPEIENIINLFAQTENQGE